MNSKLEIGSKVKLKSFFDEDYGSCEGSAKLSGVGLDTVLTVRGIKVDCGEVFLSFDEPYLGFYGWSENRFKLVE